MNDILIDGIPFRKSSLSYKGEKCVGVRFEGDTVFIINTRTKGPVLAFSKGEWAAFLAGVKKNEFDIEDTSDE